MKTRALQSAAHNAAANAIFITNRMGPEIVDNPAFGDLTGYTTAEAIGKNPRDLVKSGQQDLAFYKNLWETILSGQIWHSEIINRRKDGTLYTEEQTITPVYDGQNQISHFIAIKQDVTPRKMLEAENRKLTEQFYQAQKMESIGQLAGGIAHDFNNLLVPIVGYAELGMMATAPDSALYTHFERIKGAGERASRLTRQILAFSRRQVLEMRMVNLNEVVIEFEKMLQRLIGENITFKTHLTADLPPIKADQGQLEQVLLNLVVNARDAMPNGGQLTIETSPVVLDEAYVANHIGTQPGPHVQLAVSDTGHGMDAATQQRIFEPFFTTKSRGHGTGLGLSTVFGIIKQHGGNIWVYSEPGQGTTFKVYLPLAPASTPTLIPEPPVIKSLEGSETILVVEDEISVRQLVTGSLQAYGYQVIEADTPAAGLAAAASPGNIHLLLTDVILPTMNGRELFQQLAAIRPGLKVLYMSGYTDNSIAKHGVLSEGTAFLQKPFSIRNLLQKVRIVLETNQTQVG
jgi:PAS domain S-box-containing protein